MGLRGYLLTAFSGDPNGVPDWVEGFGEGSDEGFFGPDSAVWAVHGAKPVLVAGIRALLLQTLHPGAMAGVHDWSRYQEDPLGRLAGTVRWVMTTTFDDRAGAESASAFVRSLHTRVVGSYADTTGSSVPYAASDPELLRWVHVVFAESFLSCHQAWERLAPGAADAYVREWAIAGELMGVENPPRSEADLRDQLAEFAPRLVADERVAEAVRFIRHPPLTKSVLPGYRVLFAGAVSTLPDDTLRMLGLRRPRWPVRTATKLVLWGLGMLLGRPSSSEKYARMRLVSLAGDTA